MVHKLTIRLDDAVWRGMKDYLAVNAITATAWFQAGAEMALARHEGRGREPVSFESADPVEVASQILIRRARKIDAERRNGAT